MINLEVPKKFTPAIDQARAVAEHVLRPISRQYDRDEHTYAKELDMLAAAMAGMEESGSMKGTGATGVKREKSTGENRNASNMSTVLSIKEAAKGDLGLMLTIPGQGLGNSAIASVASDEQMERFKGKWAAMAITEPDAGSDSSAINTTAVRDGDHYILNGTKIFITAGERADLLVVWATLDKALGKTAIKSFVVEKGTPGLQFVRSEDKLGIRASDTAQFVLEDCRVPAENLLGDPEISAGGGFAGAMQTFDNTRPLVASMGIGVAEACLERTRELLAEAGVEVDWDKPAHSQSAAAQALLDMEADFEAARLLTLKAAWMADNAKPNSLEASYAKAKAGRMVVDVALRCVQLCGPVGYGETELLEKWARDAKILDIFEGTQQIQLLIIARRLLGLSSAQLR
ncbi:MAG: acyl-CoA dehydrogenase family protein [Actinomycetota bacterium]|uniref:acyl-CoA dehydrogenase family protein n=1 Tax=Euzebya pacifica TaxID=1608957 RepID=UPI0030FCA785